MSRWWMAALLPVAATQSPQGCMGAGMGLAEVLAADGEIALTLGAAEVLEGTPLSYVVCGTTANGFAVDPGTGFWVTAFADEADSDGEVSDPVVFVTSKGRTGCASGTLDIPNDPGTLTITATSGQAAPVSKDIVVRGVATQVITDASTTQLGPDGGTVTVSTQVLTTNGEPLASAQIRFTSTHGHFVGATMATTDQFGTATATLETDRTATITATTSAMGAAPTDVLDDVLVEVEAPRVAWLTPAQQVWSADATVQVHGSGFSKDATVRFGASAAEVRSGTDRVIEVVLPYWDPTSGEPDDVTVTVINANGLEVSFEGGFTYLRAL